MSDTHNYEVRGYYRGSRGGAYKVIGYSVHEYAAKRQAAWMLHMQRGIFGAVGIAKHGVVIATMGEEVAS